MATNQDFKVKNGMKLGGSISLYDNATPSNGQLLIGNATNGDLQLATLTQGTGVVITNGAGSITVATNGVSTNTASTLVLRDASGNFSAGTITATLSGNASTATSATSATSATNTTNVGVTNDVATATSVFPVWVTANTGNLPAKVSSTALSFVPSTGSLTATTFVGALTGNASTATSIAAGAAGNILYQSGAGVTAKLTTGTSSQVLVSGTTPSWTNTPTLTGTNFTGIPNAGLTNSSVTIGSTSVSLGATATTLAGLTSVTSTTFVGALSGNASTATSATSATTATESAYANGMAFWDATSSLTTTSTLASAGSRSVAIAPTGFTQGIYAQFVNAALVSGTGTYAGLITVAPWMSTTASTGDPSYQLAFSPAATNSTSAPTLKIRAGIDTTWGSWSTFLHSSNFNTYAPTLTGTGASGTWSITAANASTLTNLAPSSSATASTVATRDGNGYLYAAYLNQSSANNENPAISQVMVTNGSDGFLRKASISALSDALTGVPNSALTNSSLTLGSTSMALGSTTTTVAGLTSLTATNLFGATSDSSFISITNPGGANYNGAAATTGAIAITLPVGMTSSMVRMTVKIYDYATNEAFTVYCGGYNYVTGLTWANNPFAYIIANPGANRNFTVRFGYTAGAKAVVYIGELASTWAYPQVTVTDVQVGFGGRSSTWLSGWSIGVQATAFENVTATVSSPQIGYQATANTANTVVLRDGSGNFSAGTITAALTGTATLANDLTGGAANQVVYQSGASTTSFVTNAAGVLQAATSGAVPAWTTTPTLTGTNFSGTAASLTAGAASKIAGTSVTNLNTALSLTAGDVYFQIYTATATNPPPTIPDNANGLLTFVSHPSGGVGTYGRQFAMPDNDNIYTRYVTNGSFGAWRTLVTDVSGTAFLASDLAGGAANQVVYQSGANATSFVTNAAGVLQAATSGAIPAWTTTPTLTGTNFSGTAASLTAGTATNATNTAITDDTTTAATMYPTWVTAATGNLPQKVSSTKFTFNPSTGTLTTIKAVVNPNTTGVSTGLTVTNGDITAYRSGGTTGVVYLSSSGSNYLYWDATNYNLNGGGLVVTGDVTAFSDARIKKDVQVIPDALAKVEALRGVTFERTDVDDGKRHTGVIAQEVQAVLPEAVMEGETLSVAYGNMVGLLIEAIKDLSAQNKALLARVQALESK